VTSSLRHFPLGHSVVDSPHSVCVSLPSFADVIGYEEKDPATVAAMRSGYPRFFENPLISQLRSWVEHTHLPTGHAAILTATQAAARDCVAFSGGGSVFSLQLSATTPPLCGVSVPLALTAVLAAAKAWRQHTGCGISSRCAEDYLLALGLIRAPHPEPLYAGVPLAADRQIRDHLHRCYGTHSPDDILLASGGMNAFYAGFRAVQQLMAARGRQLWVQLGWLYVDTACILEKFSPPNCPPIIHHNVFDLSGLASVLDAHRGQIAGIVTEVPTNPLVQTCDLAALRQLADVHGCALIVDPTIASPHNVHVLPFADLHINSLTKYAGHAGDVMVGALAINHHSPLATDLRALIPQFVSPPYARDVQRLATLIDHYPAVLRAINANTRALVQFLTGHPQVTAVWWAGHPASRDNYAAIQHPDSGWGGIVSFTTQLPKELFYDRLAMAKSPSFGTTFSMLCPFMYLAHYGLVSSLAGRAALAHADLPPDLFRLSVGTEPVADIIQTLAAALQPA
jgi:cystathionine gamma-synthase